MDVSCLLRRQAPSIKICQPQVNFFHPLFLYKINEVIIDIHYITKFKNKN